MKMIQQIIRGIEPDKIENEYFFQYPLKLSEMGKELDGKTVKELKERQHGFFKGFISSLLSITPKSKDGKQCILFLTKTYNKEERFDLCLVYADELLAATSLDHESVPSYSYMLTPREDAMAFLVADNKLTQDHLMTVVTRFLWEISFFGYNEEDVRKKAEELKKSMDETETLEARPAEEVFEELHEGKDWPRDEIYPREKEFEGALSGAMWKYYDYCRGMELARIKESLLEEGLV